MRNRTRVIAAAAVTAALAAGSTAAAATASTTAAKPGAPATTVSASERCVTDSQLAAALGVSAARFDQAVRAVKTSLAKANAKPTSDQFEAALARALGIPQARVEQAFAAGQPCGSQRAGRPGGAKGAPSGANERQLRAEFAAAVARQLHVTVARASAALAPLFAAGHADPSSPAFAAAARSLGVTVQQLATALMNAKQSLAPGH